MYGVLVFYSYVVAPADNDEFILLFIPYDIFYP